MRIDRLVLRSGDPAALRDFFVRAFAAEPSGSGFRLGEERIDIEPGVGGGEGFAGNESGFQHFAIAVADIDAAYARLQATPGWRPISLGGPQRLPALSGGGAAFKFRDPEGHPLELLQFASASALWRARFAAAAGRLFHGVDHTAVSVSDSAASARFYGGLGFVRVHEHVNVGPEQARLDGFAGLDSAAVEITSLSPPGGERPGVELLGYRNPAPVRRLAADGGTAATSIVLDGGHENGPARDLDGHRLAYRTRK